MSNLSPLVEPHALHLESIADDMERDGIGGDANSGHALTLRRMAAAMRADAAQGKMPHSFDPYQANKPYWAAQSAAAEQQSVLLTNTLRACKDAGVAVPATNRFASLAELDRALAAAFKDHPSAISYRIELKNKIFASGLVESAAPAVDEKRVKHVEKLLRAAGITEYSKSFTLEEWDALFKTTTLTPEARMSLKSHLVAAGILAGSAGMVRPPPPINTRINHSIFDNLGIDEPAIGHKVSLGALNAAMARANMSTRERIATKMRLTTAGQLD